jgi:hypothetical protein
MLAVGNRIAVLYDFEHGGAAGGFSFEVRWGATVAVHRDAGASDVLATGRVDAGVVSGGARLSSQSWGTNLPFAATVVSAADAYTNGLSVDFLGKVGTAGDTATLKNFAVVRMP